MIICHAISDDPQYAGNSNYNTRKQIAESAGPISFDGVYESVWENRDILKGRGGILFVTGKYVGAYNDFDTGQPRAKFATWEQIEDLMDMGFELGWHTWSHPDLTQAPSISEIVPRCPYYCKHFAYPYGKHNALIEEIVRDLGYEYGWSVNRGDDSQYQKKRWHI